jgi:hypothetical protein
VNHQDGRLVAAALWGNVPLAKCIVNVATLMISWLEDKFCSKTYSWVQQYVSSWYKTALLSSPANGNCETLHSIWSYFGVHAGRKNGSTVTPAGDKHHRHTHTPAGHFCEALDTNFSLDSQLYLEVADHGC